MTTINTETLAYDDYLNIIKTNDIEKMKEYGFDENNNYGCKDCENCKNCYKCNNCKNCLDCTLCDDCVNCSDCLTCYKCINCYSFETVNKFKKFESPKYSGCVDCEYCEGCVDCKDCVNCTSSRFLEKCTDCICCANCIGCTNCDFVNDDDYLKNTICHTDLTKRVDDITMAEYYKQNNIKYYDC